MSKARHVIHDISKQIEQRTRIGKIFAKIIELIEGITIMKVTSQGSGEEPLS